MPAFHKPVVILGASFSWALAAFGCGSSTSGGDDDDPGSVLGAGAGGTTGGAATTGGTGGKGGGTSGGKGGTGTTGGSAGSGTNGDCKAAGETFEVVDSMADGSCCEGLTTSCDLTTTTDPNTGISRSNGMCACQDAGAVTGGTGGTGGAGGSTGGTSGTGGAAAGTGGSAGTAGSGALGAGCGSDGDCASGLVCVTETGGMLDVGSPGGGLCTLACTADTECTALAPGSYCVAFDEAQTITYCLEGCVTGSAGQPKCNGRADFACGLLGLIPGSTMCTTSDDCASTELCSTTSVCGEIVTGCVPNCGGDFHCAPGDFCDFSTGLCVPDAPGGQAIGTSCDPNATTDVCSGFCSPTTEAATEGVCSAFCTLAPDLLGCGWDGTTVADAACLFLTRLSPDLGVGDLGLCGALCDCNDDCAALTDRCIADADITTVWGRAGYCRALQTGETEADTIACQ